MLKAENLRKSFGPQLLFEGVTFNVNPGERIGLVGRNGSGKTTLMRILAGLEEPDGGVITLSRGYRVGYLDQHLHFPAPTLLDEACRGLPDGEAEQRWRAGKVLAGLGFSTADLARPPSEFSGGFQVRLNLARLLLSAPDLLLLDEPTNYLDVVAIRWLERFLAAWPGEAVVVTHDRSFMDAVATHVMGIHRQRLRKMPGDTGKFYAQIEREEEIHEKSRVNLERKRQQTEDFIRRFRAKARLVGLVQSRLRTLEKQELPERLAPLRTLDFSFRAAPFDARVMLEAEGVAFSFGRGAPPLFQSLSLQVGRRDRVAVIGPNGRGKSTLLRVLAGELPPREGRVRAAARLSVGYYGQTNVDRLQPQRTVLEEVLAVEPDRSVQRARAVCGAMMFEGDAALKPVSVLSGGERSRVLLGRLLTEPLHLLLLDEPTNHLDMDSAEALLAAVDEFEGAVVIVTHNERFLHTLADRLVVFDGEGARVFDGGYAEFLEKVGWSAEPSPSAPASGEDPAPRPAPPRRADRRARAERIQERSRDLRPREARVLALEASIADLEGRSHTLQEMMVDASVRGAGAEIADLARQSRRLAQEIEERYAELLEATADLDRATAAWEASDREDGDGGSSAGG